MVGGDIKISLGFVSTFGRETQAQQNNFLKLKFVKTKNQEQ
jgi:hypothetical protein